ncbi:MAG: MFS transporter [Polyangiales bacterium]
MKLATLLALYFAQGLPFGFQATALPVLLRERGVSLATIGFAGVLAAPWLAKALWAPLVDRYGSARFGRRKSWIVPTLVLLTLTALAAAELGDDPTRLAVLVLLMNLFAATMDIAVDALATSWLRDEQLGPGNALQVVGYKLGMLTGGGLLVWASARVGWSGQFRLMAALLFVVLLLALRLPEPALEPAREGARPEAPSFAVIGQRLRAALRQPATAALITLVVTYKTGESMADAMWKPMLVDRGFSAASVGLWNGTFGMLFSLLGSSAAGIAVRRVSLSRALFVAALLRGLGVAGEWWVSLTPSAGATAVIVVTCVEHLVSGSITTVMFALMMRHTDRAIGGTHFTLLASLEVWGKLPLSLLSGVLATALGYAGLFGVGAGLCAGFALLAGLLAPRLADARAAPVSGRPS